MNTNMKFARQKEAYYKWLLSSVYVEPDYKSHVVKCKVCKYDFHYVNSKKELLKLIEENVDENGYFPLEMIKLMKQFDYPGADSISFHKNEGICACCYLHKPKESFLSKIKKFFKLNEKK